MSIKGFKFDGVVHKYDYNSLDNIPDLNTETDKTLAIDGVPADAKATGDRISNLQSLVGSPLTASTAASMTDTNKVYVYTGSETGYTNGNWYYHDGTSWVSGGVYNSVAVDLDSTLTLANKAPDSKVVGDAISSLNEDISNLSESVGDLKSAFDALDVSGAQILNDITWTSGKYVNNSTNQITNGSAQLYMSDYIPIGNIGLSRILVQNINSLSVAWTAAFFDDAKQFVSGIMVDSSHTLSISDVPHNAAYLVLTNYNSGAFPIENIVCSLEYFQRFQKMENEISTLKAQTIVDESYNNILHGASTFQDNKFINDRGQVVSNNNFCLIDGYFPVKPNTTYKLYRGEPPLYSNAGHNWTWWNENKQFISYVLSGSAVTSPENAAYLRFGVYISNTGSATHEDFNPSNVVITEDAKPEFDVSFTNSFVTHPTFRGLKWIGIGDSITEANFRATYHYWDYIVAETGLNFVNMGVSGTGYKAEGSGDKAFYKRVPSMATDADIITIFGGVNDIVLSRATIGTETDTGTETICGCVNETLDAIETLYPAHMPIGIISPLPCACVDTTVNLYPLQNPNDDTCRMALFVEQLALICKHRGIPFLDLFHQSNLRPWHQECNAMYFSCDPAKTGDGLHPNGHGHRLIYRQIMDFVQKIAMK